MNTEKLEKLKKSLDNQFVPDNMKDKIRAEIKKIEAEIEKESKSTSEINKEVKEVEKKVEEAIEKAEEKAEQEAEPKKRRGRPAKAKETPAEPKATETTIKKTAMAVAKSIRKDGEKWSDAMKRANGVMNKEKVEAKKTTKSELDRLLARVRKNKSLMSELSGVKDLSRDAVRKAKPVGKRISKTGNVYYEYRANKTDRKTYGKYAFADGGKVEFVKEFTYKDGIQISEGKTDDGKIFYSANVISYPLQKIIPMSENKSYVVQRAKDIYKSMLNYKKTEDFKEIYGDKKFELGGSVVTDLAGHQDGTFGVANHGILDGFSNTSYSGLVGETGAMSSGEMFAKGGKIYDRKKDWMNYDENHLINKNNGMIVLKSTNLNEILPKDIKGFNILDNRSYANGGGVDKNFEIELFWKGLSGNERKIAKYVVSEKTLDNLEEQWNHILSIDVIDETNKKPISWYELKKELFSMGREKNLFMAGGSVGMVNQQVIDDASQSYVNYYLGEGASAGIYKDGGGIPNNYEGKSPKEVWELLTYTQKEHFLSDHLTPNQFDYSKRKGLSKKDLAKVSWDDLTFGIKKEFGEHISMGQYAKGGGVRKVGNREYSYGRNWTNDHRHTNKSEEHEVKYTRKGKFLGVFNKGGSVTNERKHVNHNEDYEVRYAKTRPNRKGYLGKRKFADGGGIEDNAPQIYVADLEAYNNGRLSGVWLNLLDYSDADELMDAINDFLKTSGGEEFAIHDYENLPRSMYSEYMGERDFQEIYDMIDLAKDKDLPLEVVMEITHELGENAVDEFYGVYDSEEDFAEQLVDDIGIQSFNNFEYYLEITDTDRRLLAQDMADSYVDNIRDEDGGNRLIEEAGLDVEEYEEADSDRQEEMLDEAREIVYDQYYDTWYEGLDDPYYFLVEEQGLYDAESFANADFVRIDIEKLARELEYDYTFIRHDGQVYVFNVR